MVPPVVHWRLHCHKTSACYYWKEEVFLSQMRMCLSLEISILAWPTLPRRRLLRPSLRRMELSMRELGFWVVVPPLMQASIHEQAQGSSTSISFSHHLLNFFSFKPSFFNFYPNNFKFKLKNHNKSLGSFGSN